MSRFIVLFLLISARQNARFPDVIPDERTHPLPFFDKCYEEVGMWPEALRVCQRHLPHLVHKVQLQYQVK